MHGTDGLWATKSQQPVTDCGFSFSCPHLHRSLIRWRSVCPADSLRDCQFCYLCIFTTKALSWTFHPERHSQEAGPELPCTQHRTQFSRTNTSMSLAET